VVTICSDECLHLWEISNRDGLSFLEHVRSLSLESKYVAGFAENKNLKLMSIQCRFLCQL